MPAAFYDHEPDGNFHGFTRDLILFFMVFL
jgi:hypothetical protein